MLEVIFVIWGLYFFFQGERDDFFASLMCADDLYVL